MPAADKKLKVSMAPAGDVNNDCHTNMRDVKPHNRHVMPHPKVKVILWGHFYVEHPDAVVSARQLVSAIVSGRFMNGLAQYGVGRGSLVDVQVIDTNSASPAPATLSRAEAQDQLIQWLRAGFVAPTPALNETNLLYLLFPPITTILTPADEGFCGYHSHGKFNGASNHDDLFWATFRTHGTPSTGDALIRSVSFCVSHEMNEAFTDRDSDGYFADNGCEIGDLCEAFGNTSGHVTTFSYQSFGVELYWSNWDHTCIHGDDPVRLRRFLKAVAPGGIVLPGVRWLGMPVVGLEAIAQKMRA